MPKAKKEEKGRNEKKTAIGVVGVVAARRCVSHHAVHTRRFPSVQSLPSPGFSVSTHATTGVGGTLLDIVRRVVGAVAAANLRESDLACQCGGRRGRRVKHWGQ